MPYLTTIGELLIDFTPSGENSQGMALFARNPGGGVANVAAMFAKLGGQASFLGKVGKDDFGSFLLNTMQSSNVDCQGLIEDPEALTTLAFVQLDEKGDRSFTFYRKPGADLLLRPEEICYDRIDRCQVFHFGAVSLTDEPSRSATFSAAAYAKEAGKLISFDPNYRPFLWPNPEQAKEQMEKGAALADLLKVSEEEMTLLTGQQELAAGSERLLSMGPSLVLVSLGAQGAFFRTRQAMGRMATYDVPTVDTTGAGDAFVGSMLLQLAHLSPGELGGLDEQSLREMVDFANAAGSLTTTRKGAIPAMPTREEIQQCRASASLLDG